MTQTITDREHTAEMCGVCDERPAQMDADTGSPRPCSDCEREQVAAIEPVAYTTAPDYFERTGEYISCDPTEDAMRMHFIRITGEFRPDWLEELRALAVRDHDDAAARTRHLISLMTPESAIRQGSPLLIAKRADAIVEHLRLDATTPEMTAAEITRAFAGGGVLA